MPGSIHISATQPPVITPLFLQVAVGKTEYSGNIEQDDLSFPVTSLRESMVMMLYNADRELISKSELKTKVIVESGTMDAVFTLDSGGKIILQVQFLLNDYDRRRIQEMRNSAMKRKQQELLGDGNELNFPDSPLSKRLIEKISNIQSKGAERSKLRKSLSLDDLGERAVFSGINVDPQMRVSRSRDLLLQRGVRDTLSLEKDPSGSKKGNSIPESKSSSSVKKMISTFEGTTPQGIVSETDISPTPTDSGSTQAGKPVVIPFDDHRASNYRSGETVSSQNIKTSEPVQTGMPKTTQSRRSCRSESGVSPTPTDSSSMQGGKAVIAFDDHTTSNFTSRETISYQHIKTSERVQTGMPRTSESRRSCRSESGVSPTPTDSCSTHGGKAVIPFDDHTTSSSQHIKTSEPVQTGMPRTSENRRNHRSETGVSPTPTDSCSTQAGKGVIPFDDHKASNYMSGETVLCQHIKTSEHVQTEMPKTSESRRNRRSETGVSPTPTDSDSTQAGKPVIHFDDHKASNYRLGETISSQHKKASEPVQTRMPKTTESRRSHGSETGVSPAPTDSGSVQAGRAVIPFDDHNASKYRSGETVSSQHMKMSAAVQTGMPKTTESRRTEAGVSSTPTDSGGMQAGKSVMPFDDHKASNYRSGKTVSSQHIKTSTHVQIGMPKATEIKRSRRPGSRDGASKQNLRENELIRTKRRSQAKHHCSTGPSYLAEQMHLIDYVERPLNYLIATSSTWIHPHICVTSASKQLKDLLELEHLNSLAHIQHTAKRQHVKKGTQEKNKRDESTIAAQTQNGSFLMINEWLINQGVRAAIVVIACGALFFNNR